MLAIVFYISACNVYFIAAAHIRSPSFCFHVINSEIIITVSLYSLLTRSRLSLDYDMLNEHHAIKSFESRKPYDGEG